MANLCLSRPACTLRLCRRDPVLTLRSPDAVRPLRNHGHMASIISVRAARCHRVQVQAVPSASGQPVAEQVTELKFSNLLLTIMDSNSYLSDGSKQAVSTAALLALKDSGKVTVLIIDEPGTKAQEPEKQVECISWHLRNTGLTSFEVVQRTTTDPASVLIGDIADELVADMVVVSSDSVHSKYVDANQLAEFVSCPLLVLP